MLKKIEAKNISMIKIAAMLRERQGDRSPEAFAKPIGIAGASLRAYYKGQRHLGHPNALKLVEYFQEAGDMEMAEAVRIYFQQKTAI